MGVSKRKAGRAERREHLRIDQSLRIDFKLDSGDDFLVGETYNLSAAGVYCRVNSPVREMTQLMIRLELPTGPITCVGTVVRAEPGPNGSDSHHLAIFFNKISEEDNQQLVKFLEG